MSFYVLFIIYYHHIYCSYIFILILFNIMSMSYVKIIFVPLQSVEKREKISMHYILFDFKCTIFVSIQLKYRKQQEKKTKTETLKNNATATGFFTGQATSVAHTNKE